VRAGFAIRASSDDAETARLEKVLATTPDLPPTPAAAA
jgi:hypothetical protein